MTDSMTPRQLALWNRCSTPSDNEDDAGMSSDNSYDTDEEWLAEIILSHVASIPIPRPVSIHGAEVNLVSPLGVPAIMQDYARVKGVLSELEPETDLKLALPTVAHKSPPVGVDLGFQRRGGAEGGTPLQQVHDRLLASATLTLPSLLL